MPIDGPSTPERELVSRCLVGDADAWDAFLRRYSPYLGRVIQRALRRLGETADPTTVQDLLQETFAALLDNDRAALRRFRPGLPLEPYLTAIATYRCLRRMRKGVRDAARLEEARARLIEDLASGPQADPGARLAAGDLSRRLREALSRIPETERELIRLFYWAELPAPRIARYLGIRTGSVWALLSRARKRLAGFLRDQALLF